MEYNKMEFHISNGFKVFMIDDSLIFNESGSNKVHYVSVNTFVNFICHFYNYYYKWLKYGNETSFFVSSFDDMLCLNIEFKKDCSHFFLITYDLNCDRERLITTIHKSDEKEFLIMLHNIYGTLCDNTHTKSKLEGEEREDTYKDI